MGLAKTKLFVNFVAGLAWDFKRARGLDDARFLVVSA
jgi:hypothetical protein